MDEGREVTVRCVASGATPAAEIYWNSEPEMDLSDVTEETKRFVTKLRCHLHKAFKPPLLVLSIIYSVFESFEDNAARE